MRTYFFIFIFFLSVHSLFSWAQKNFFDRFPNAYFVETGSYKGAGIEAALKAGFSEIHSIELAQHFYEHCRKRFESNPQVHLWHGDSASLLEKVISSINQPITFWLDGHYSGGDTAKGKTNTPILSELNAIKKHPIKTHTILIDDVRNFNTEIHDNIPLKVIIIKIRSINPKYKISFEKGYVDNDILVAEIK